MSQQKSERPVSERLVSNRFQLKTPVGTTLFSMLHHPSTKFKAEGEYFVILSLEAKEAQPLIEKIHATLQEFKQNNNINPKLKMQGEPYVRILDAETQQDTGFVKFKFVRRGHVSKEDGVVELTPPAMFDAKGQPIRLLALGHGSKVALNYNLSPWASPLGYGVSLKLNAVQVIKWVPFNQGDPNDAASWGFESHAEGFEASDVQKRSPKGSSGASPQGDLSRKGTSSGDFQDDTSQEVDDGSYF